MSRRLLLGLLKGSLVGGLFAYAMVAGLGVTALSGAFAYLAAVGVSFFTALVAGRPIWAAGAWVEVLLKAIAGAAVASGLLFAATRYVEQSANLGPLGQGHLVQLPYVILPLLATLLAVFFEAGNNDSKSATHESSASGSRIRVGNDGQPSSAAEDGVLEEFETPATRERRS
jgi:hypothetical protein